MQNRMLRILISSAALGVLLLGSALYLHAGAGSGTAKAQSVYSSLSKIQKGSFLVTCLRSLIHKARRM